MLKSTINLGLSLDLQTGDLSSLKEHKNIFSGHVLIHSISELNKFKFLKNILNQITIFDNLDIFYIDSNKTNLTNLFKSYNYLISNNKNYFDLSELKNFYLFDNSETNLDSLIDILIERSKQIQLNKKIKETYIFINNVSLDNEEKIIDLFNKVGGLGFKIIITTNSFNNTYLYDYVFTNIYFNMKEYDKSKINKLIKNYNDLLEFMKIENLNEKMFLYVNKKIIYGKTNFIK